MSDLGQMLRLPAVRFERHLSGSAERVWEHLTDCSKLAGWYGDDSAHRAARRRTGAAHGRPHPGRRHPMAARAQAGPHLERLLARRNRVVLPGVYLTLEIEPAGDGARLVLTHLPVLERFEGQNAMGWHTFLDILEAGLIARPIEPRPAYMQRNAALYGVDLTNLQR